MCRKLRKLKNRMQEEKFNFSEAYKEIEEINEWFKREDIDLEEALAKYERGMELISKCKQRLQEVENKFQEIKKKYLGE